MSEHTDAIRKYLERIGAEVERADRKWGYPRDAPDGTGTRVLQDLAQMSRWICDHEFSKGTGEWRHILSEEFHEALAESDPHRLKAELVQVAAVCVSWMRAIEERE